MTSRRLLPILAVLAVVAAAVAGPARAELLYVIQNDNIYSYDVSLGSASAIAASRQNVLVGSPYVQASYGMAFDSTGSFYVSSMGSAGSGSWVAKFDAYGNYVSQITELMNGPLAVAVDSADNLYVLDVGPHPAVVKYTSAGAVYGSIANLPIPSSLAVSGAGDIYVGFYVDKGDRIKMYGSDMMPTGTISSDTNWVNGLAIGPSGNLYSVDSFGYIDVFTASGGYLQQLGNGNPNDLTTPVFDSAGNLYLFTGSDSISIAKFSASGAYQFSWSVGTYATAMTYGPVLVPEPSAYAMAIGGIVIVAWRSLRQRRRRDRSA